MKKSKYFPIQICISVPLPPLPYYPDDGIPLFFLASFLAFLNPTHLPATYLAEFINVVGF